MQKVLGITLQYLTEKDMGALNSSSFTLRSNIDYLQSDSLFWVRRFETLYNFKPKAVHTIKEYKILDKMLASGWSDISAALEVDNAKLISLYLENINMKPIDWLIKTVKYDAVKIFNFLKGESMFSTYTAEDEGNIYDVVFHLFNTFLTAETNFPVKIEKSLRKELGYDVGTMLLTVRNASQLTTNQTIDLLKANKKQLLEQVDREYLMSTVSTIIEFSSNANQVNSLIELFPDVVNEPGLAYWCYEGLDKGLEKGLDVADYLFFIEKYKIGVTRVINKLGIKVLKKCIELGRDDILELILKNTTFDSKQLRYYNKNLSDVVVSSKIRGILRKYKLI